MGSSCSKCFDTDDILPNINTETISDFQPEMKSIKIYLNNHYFDEFHVYLKILFI